jgi:hypothetical protein
MLDKLIKKNKHSKQKTSTSCSIKKKENEPDVQR